MLLDDNVILFTMLLPLLLLVLVLLLLLVLVLVLVLLFVMVLWLSTFTTLLLAPMPAGAAMPPCNGGSAASAGVRT